MCVCTSVWLWYMWCSCCDCSGVDVVVVMHSGVTGAASGVGMVLYMVLLTGGVGSK